MKEEELERVSRRLLDFIDKISCEDKVAIITDVDLDGLASAIFLEEILNYNYVKTSSITLQRKKLDEIKISEYKEKQITKVFILDIAMESFDTEGYQLLKNNFDVFLVDHHPSEYDFSYNERVIKTDSSDCTALTIFNIGIQTGSLEEKEWSWLACATAFSEFSYQKPENLELIKKYYPEFNSENGSTTIPGINARRISSAMIYYQGQEKTLYNLVKEKNIEQMGESQKIIEEEIDKKMQNFFKKAEFFPGRKMYIYNLQSNYDIKSYLTTLISKIKPEYSFIILKEIPEKNQIKVSARNQSKNPDMNLLIKKAIKNIPNSAGGGHAAAAGAIISKEDYPKFKENILN